MALHIAGRTRIGVVPPRATNRRAAFEQRHRAEPGAFQQHGQTDAAEAGSDDSDAQTGPGPFRPAARRGSISRAAWRNRVICAAWRRRVTCAAWRNGHINRLIHRLPLQMPQDCAPGRAFYAFNH